MGASSRWTCDAALREHLEEHLRGFPRRPLPFAGRRAAAVAVTVVETAGGAAAFLLTRRAPRGSHAGQFALPGGKLDAGEGPVEAARRELAEEVGVAVGEGGVLGLLDDYPTRSGFRITPVVLWAGAVEAVADPREVAAVYRVELAELDRPDALVLTPGEVPERPILSLAVAGTRVFSPTAAVLHQFREVALHGRPTRVAHYDQPRFAWR